MIYATFDYVYAITFPKETFDDSKVQSVREIWDNEMPRVWPHIQEAQNTLLTFFLEEDVKRLSLRSSGRRE